MMFSSIYNTYEPKHEALDPQPVPNTAEELCVPCAGEQHLEI